MQRRLAAIIHADVVGYSRLMEGNETVTLRRLKQLRKQLWEPAIERHNGRLVGTAGDALLIEFASAVSAVRCAIDLQNGMGERNETEPDHRRMLLRIGINLGEVIVDEDDDIFGDGVNVAARLQAMADPGGILVSAKVHDEVVDRMKFEFVDGGEQQIKNIVRPVRVYRLSFGTEPAGQQAPAVRPAEPAGAAAAESIAGSDAAPSRESTVPGGDTAAMAPITRTHATVLRRVENSWTFSGQDRDGVAFELVIAARDLKAAPAGLVLGRHSGQSDVVVAHGSLSRRHCRLRIDSGRLTIEDLGSTNGTIVDGMRLPADTPRPLRAGAQLLLGEIRFVVSETGASDRS